MVTIGGIYGTVVEVKEKTLLLEVDSNVKIKVDKNSVGQGLFCCFPAVIFLFPGYGTDGWERYSTRY